MFTKVFRLIFLTEIVYISNILLTDCDTLTFIVPCIANVFAEYNQQDATFHKLFISARRSTYFRSFDILLTVHLNIFILILNNLMH